jgi:hypothetical protein
MSTLASFLLNAVCAWVGLLLLSIPLCLSSPELLPTSRRDLIEHVLTVLLLALSLAALAA